MNISAPLAHPTCDRLLIVLISLVFAAPGLAGSITKWDDESLQVTLAEGSTLVDESKVARKAGLGEHRILTVTSEASRSATARLAKPGSAETAGTYEVRLSANSNNLSHARNAVRATLRLENEGAAQVEAQVVNHQKRYSASDPTIRDFLSLTWRDPSGEMQSVAVPAEDVSADLLALPRAGNEAAPYRLRLVVTQTTVQAQVFVGDSDEATMDSGIQAIGAPSVDTAVLEVAAETGGEGQLTQIRLLELTVPWALAGGSDAAPDADLQTDDQSEESKNE